jgi:hypothetical protein
MKSIWKYEFDGSNLEMNKMIPEESILLDVQLQRETVCAWFLVDPTNKMVQRNLRIYVTGESIPDNSGKYVATAQMNEYVLHIFDMGENDCIGLQ